MTAFRSRFAVGCAVIFSWQLWLPRATWADTGEPESAAASASLTLEVSEASALVTVDGVVRGVTPLEGPLPLPVGRHQLELFKAGFVRLTRDVELVAGAQLLRLEMEAEARVATLSVGASLLPASLVLDGRDVGPLPWFGEVSPGEHTLSARSSQATSAEQRIFVGAGQRVVVTLPMTVRMAQVRVQVPDASIFVDGKWVGVGAYQGPLPPGSHQLRLKRIGYPAKEYDVSLAPGEVWTVANVTWDAPKEQGEAEAQRSSFRGLYAQIGLLGLFSRAPTDGLKQDCPARRTGGDCEWHGSYGAGLGVRVGYSFNWVAVEGLGIASADAWYDESRYDVQTDAGDSAFYGVPRREQYTFARYGGGVAVGARLLSPTPSVRATLGAAIGVLRRSERYFRVSSTAGDPNAELPQLPDARADASSVDGDTAGLFAADLGVLFGSTPGLKFHLGLLVAVTFASASQVESQRGVLGRDLRTGAGIAHGTGSLDVSRGAQTFFGPILGVQLGH